MVNDLIFDVGLHDGSDTAYYLSKGFRVIGIDANPLFANQAEENFADEIAAGRLTVENVGIGPDEGIIPFWVNDDNSTWSSFEKEKGCRNGTSCHCIDVPCVRFRDLLDKYGVPYYLKADIEGYDIHCLQDLTPDDTPTYVSIEANGLEYLCLLYALGYRQFKCINQVNHNDPTTQRRPNERRWRMRLDRVKEFLADASAISIRSVPYLRGALDRIGVLSVGRNVLVPRRECNGEQKTDSSHVFKVGSSGPFGEDTYGEWESLEEVAYNWLHFRFGKKDRGTLNTDAWYDFHAKKGDV